MNSETVLVLGATGKIGRRVVDHLTAAGLKPSPGSRHAVPPFDWDIPATWKPALEGVDGIFLLLPEGVNLDPSFLHIIADDQPARVVLLSSQGIEEMGDQRLLSAEQHLKDIIEDFAIIRADWFNQNFSEGFFRDSVVTGQIVMPVADTKQAFVDAHDIASVAVALLTQHRDATGLYHVTGPQALGFADVATILSEVTDTTVTFDGTPDTYRELMSGYGVPAEQIEADITTFQALAEQGDRSPTTTVQDLTGQDGITFHQFATAAANEGVWTTP